MMSSEFDQSLEATPWKSVGTIPSNEQFQKLYNSDERVRTMAGYGFYKIDQIIKEERPDVLIVSQDIWACAPLTARSYWNKFPCIIWTTLDSLPIHEKALESCLKCSPGNFWVWSNFAEKDMKKNGYENVKTVHSLFNTSEFFPLLKVKKEMLRKRFNIPLDAWICGDTCRNQLRKTLPALIEGYAMFKSQNPEVKNPRLLIHTCFSEGWNIMQLAKDYKVPAEEVLTTYICSKCHGYEVKAFKGERQDCSLCQAKQSQNTTSPKQGVTNQELNEIYNLMDILVVARTSGGSEFPIYEFKLTEGITLITDYSFGEEATEEGSGSLVLDWTSYRDLTQNSFIKAATHPKSVAKQISNVYRMTPEERKKLGKVGREWAINGYSIDVVGKQIDQHLSSLLLTSYNFDFQERKPNPDATIPEIENDAEWLKVMYKDILAMPVDENDKGLAGWLEKLNKIQ